MDYIRWLIKEWEVFDTPAPYVAFVAGIFLTSLVFAANPILGIVLGMIVAAVFGTVFFIGISDAFRKSYAKYLKEKNKP